MVKRTTAYKALFANLLIISQLQSMQLQEEGLPQKQSESTKLTCPPSAPKAQSLVTLFPAEIWLILLTHLDGNKAFLNEVVRQVEVTNSIYLKIARHLLKSKYLRFHGTFFITSTIDQLMKRHCKTAILERYTTKMRSALLRALEEIDNIYVESEPCHNRLPKLFENSETVLKVDSLTYNSQPDYFP